MEELGFNIDVMGLVNSTSGAAYNFLLWAVVLVIVALLVYVLVVFLQYKHYVNVHVMTNKGSFHRRDKAREVTENGVTFWKLFKMKTIVTIPPPEAVEITQRGKFIADAYYSEETGLVWATDSVTRDKFLSMVKTSIDDKGNVTKTVHDSRQPFTTQDRALLAARITRAQQRKKKNLMELITMMAPPIMIFFMFILMLVFWEDIAKPGQEIVSQAATLSEQNAKIAEQNARLLSLIASSNGAPLVNFEQTVNAEGGG